VVPTGHDRGLASRSLERQVDLRQRFGVEQHVQRSDVFFDLARVATPGQRDRDHWIADHPGQRQQRQTCAGPIGDRQQPVDDVEVLAQVRPEQTLAEDVALAAPVTLVERVFARERTRQQPMGQRSVGHDADAELVGGREHLVLPAAIEQVVADFVGADRGELARLAQLVGREIRHPDMERLALGAQLLERAHRLGDRRLGIGPVHQHQVEMVGPQPAQTLFVDALDGRIAPIELGRVGDRVPRDADFADQHHVFAARAERATQHFLRAAEAIVRGGVKQGYTQVDSAVDRGDHFRVDAVTVLGIAHFPAAEANRRDAQAGSAKVAVLHA